MAWKVARNYKTPTECDHGYTTPLVIQHQGKESILVWGAEHLTIHDATDGQVVWSCGNFNPEANKLWPAIASPVIVGDMVVIAYGRNDRGIPRLHGIRLTGSGDVTETNHVWKRDDVGTFVPTPVVYQGRVILVRDRGEVACIDPATGKTIWSGEFPKNRANFYASPLIAGDKLYAPREDGTVFVASVANDHSKSWPRTTWRESVIGSPVPAANRLLIRGEKHLFCIAAEYTGALPMALHYWTGLARSFSSGPPAPFSDRPSASDPRRRPCRRRSRTSFPATVCGPCCTVAVASGLNGLNAELSKWAITSIFVPLGNFFVPGCQR